MHICLCGESEGSIGVAPSLFLQAISLDKLVSNQVAKAAKVLKHNQMIQRAILECGPVFLCFDSSSTRSSTATFSALQLLDDLH